MKNICCVSSECREQHYLPGVLLLYCVCGLRTGRTAGKERKLDPWTRPRFLPLAAALIALLLEVEGGQRRQGRRQRSIR